jgi:hypothetical protein
MIPSMLATILVCMLINLVNMWMSVPGVQPVLRLSMNLGIIFAVLIVLVRYPRLFSNEVNLFFEKISTELPPRIRPIINRPGIIR